MTFERERKLGAVGELAEQNAEGAEAEAAQGGVEVRRAYGHGSGLRRPSGGSFVPDLCQSIHTCLLVTPRRDSPFDGAARDTACVSDV